MQKARLPSQRWWRAWPACVPFALARAAGLCVHSSRKLCVSFSGRMQIAQLETPMMVLMLPGICLEKARRGTVKNHYDCHRDLKRMAIAVRCETVFLFCSARIKERRFHESVGTRARNRFGRVQASWCHDGGAGHDHCLASYTLAVYGIRIKPDSDKDQAELEFLVDRESPQESRGRNERKKGGNEGRRKLCSRQEGRSFSPLH